MGGLPFIQLVLAENSLDVDIKYPVATGKVEENCSELHSYINAVRDAFREHAIKLKVSLTLGATKQLLKTHFHMSFLKATLSEFKC